MALPKIETPTYELDLPSEDRKIKFRPFTVKEEKVLLIANESKNSSELLNATINVIEACTFNEIDARKSPLFDIEYIFLQLRAKSVGEMAKLRVLCPDDKETFGKIEVDLTKVEVHVGDNHNNNVLLDEKRKLGIVFGYPTIETTLKGQFVEKVDNIDSSLELIGECIDHIYEGEKVYSGKDSTKGELKEFLESLPQDGFAKIKEFFDTMPHVEEIVEVENPKTKVKSKVTLRGIQDFFQSASPT